MFNFKRVLIVLWVAAALFTSVPVELFGQSFVEYPNHSSTFGDHTVAAQWAGGPSAITLVMETDETILHADGIGQSQRTARNTQNFVDDGSPQNFDNRDIIDRYGSRLPLLQQLSANGTSTLSYRFATSIDKQVDLFVTDVDQRDDVTVRAFDDADQSIDMSQWTLVGEGDLSLIKDTGTKRSEIVAQVPTTVFNADGIRVTATEKKNYNRSYSILRAPAGAKIARIDIEFTGQRTSSSRKQPGNGSHIYVALAVAPEPVVATP